MNGGFGLVLDGTAEAAFKADSMLNWDVSNGVARRYVIFFEKIFFKFPFLYKRFQMGQKM